MKTIRVENYGDPVVAAQRPARTSSKIYSTLTIVLLGTESVFDHVLKATGQFDNLGPVTRRN